VNHLDLINKNDEYGTPHDLFADACLNYQVDPVIDVAASKTNHVLEPYWTMEDNFLKRGITNDFFMNPPYSQVREFMEHAYEQHVRHNSNVLVLVYAKTDTRWWHEFVEDKAEVHFIKGRIKFLDHNAQPTKLSAPYPSVWIIWRKK
jgi:phage N-6-adenine-methyltransferase